MRGKRSKQYRKLMEQYCMTFGFREAYQVLVDAEMVQDACRFKMDLSAGLERTVHGKVKPMITQCEIRKLYEKKSEPGIRDAIELAKNYERRRCGHHPDEYPKPLSTLECLSSVVDPKQTGQNKHRYVVASQSQEVRRALRGVRAVPLIYIKRSVMILEPMADDSADVRMREEKAKFRAELKKRTPKRKRDEDEDEDEDGGEEGGATVESAAEKKKKKYGAGKEPNPLSVKKAKKNPQQIEEERRRKQKLEAKEAAEKPKRKRRRRAKGDGDGEGATGESGAGEAGNAGGEGEGDDGDNE
ncbi:rRNA-processing protein UTP23 [Cordyceps fumosorosea ARSEF 2679]|uniref:U three protein 23 n=1 Tax=Cordyceps fumosorosea (strain ARSEF 2679) TaxID=1081104 RepID=A0A168DX76_CORFA|nr:rRNA-processing protein UTP23 [Cordyceps fumosorosea ARSEF 2679]OAA73113.1 rRNA-processing protein UTP23 [Cordyceps fumosorosea ARSEF 2679]